MAAAASPAAAERVDAPDLSERDMDALAEQTKQSTIDALSKMVAEAEAKAASLLASAAALGESEEEEKKKLSGEAKVWEGKAAALKTALAEQQSGMGVLAKQNRTARSQSSIESPVLGASRSRGFSLRGNKDKEASVAPAAGVAASPSPSMTKKGLFGTTRKKKDPE